MCVCFPYTCIVEMGNTDIGLYWSIVGIRWCVIGVVYGVLVWCISWCSVSCISWCMLVSVLVVVLRCYITLSGSTHCQVTQSYRLTLVTGLIRPRLPETITNMYMSNVHEINITVINRFQVLMNHSEWWTEEG